jgi:hypothetical protein
MGRRRARRPDPMASVGVVAIYPLTWSRWSGFGPLACRLQEVRPPVPMPASCTDSTNHRTDDTHRTEIIRRAVPRTVPRRGSSRPLITLLCVVLSSATELCGRDGVRPPFPQHAIQLPDAAVFEADPDPAGSRPVAAVSQGGKNGHLRAWRAGPRRGLPGSGRPHCPDHQRRGAGMIPLPACDSGKAGSGRLPRRPGRSPLLQRESWRDLEFREAPCRAAC